MSSNESLSYDGAQEQDIIQEHDNDISDKNNGFENQKNLKQNGFIVENKDEVVDNSSKSENHSNAVSEDEREMDSYIAYKTEESLDISSSSSKSYFIVFLLISCLVGYVQGKLHFNVVYLILTISGCSLAYYRLSRYHNHSEYKKEKTTLTKNLKTKGDAETCYWLNFVINNIWSLISQRLKHNLSESIEKSISEGLSGIVQKVHATLEFGKASPELFHIKNLSNINSLEQDEIVGELEFSLSAIPTPANKEIHPPYLYINICLGVVGVATINVPIRIQLLNILGRCRLRIKIMSEPPFIKCVDFSFTKLPTSEISIKIFEYLEIMKIPLLTYFIKQGLNTTFESLIYPKVVHLDLEELLTGEDQWFDTVSIGVIKINLIEAFDLKKSDIKGTNDVYVSFQIRQNKPLSVSKIITSDSPSWNEIHYILVNKIDLDNNMSLKIMIWDSDKYASDNLLGIVTYNLKDIVKTSRTNKNCFIFKGATNLKEHNKRFKGYLVHDVSYHNKISFKDDSFGDDCRCSLLNFAVYQAKDLEICDSIYSKQTTIPDPYAIIYLNGNPIYSTKTKLFNPSPYWNASREEFVKDWKNASILVVVKSRIMYEHHPVIGIVKINLGHELVLHNKRQFSKWFNLEGGVGYGKIRIGVIVKPVNLKIPREFMGYDVGTLVIDNIVVTDTKPPNFFSPVEKENVYCLFSLCDTDKELESNLSKEAMQWANTQYLFGVTKRYHNSLLITVKQKSGIVSNEILGCIVLNLREIIDNKLYTFTFPLIKKRDVDFHLKSGISIPDINGRKELDSYQYYISFRIGFFSGISYMHLDELKDDFVGLNMEYLIDKQNLKWKNSDMEEDNYSSTLNKTKRPPSQKSVSQGSVHKDKVTITNHHHRISMTTTSSIPTIRSIKWGTNKVKEKVSKTIFKKKAQNQPVMETDI